VSRSNRQPEGGAACDGGVGYEHALPAAANAGVEWLLIEQDETDGDPLAAVDRSLTAIRRMSMAA
jgi:hypothetical protein